MLDKFAYLDNPREFSTGKQITYVGNITTIAGIMHLKIFPALPYPGPKSNSQIEFAYINTPGTNKITRIVYANNIFFTKL